MVNLHLPGVNGAFAIGNHGLKTGQDPPATCEMRVVSCANPHRNRDNEIVTPTLRHRQSRWDFAHQGKPFTSLAMEALPAKQRVSSNCEVTLRTRYMTKNHTRYTHKQTCKDDNECDNKQRMDRQTLSDESDWIS